MFELPEFLNDFTLLDSVHNVQVLSTQFTRSFTSGYTILRIRVSNNYTDRRN